MMKKKMTIDEMRILIHNGIAKWVYTDRENGIGWITTSEGKWDNDPESDGYELVS